MISHIDIGRKNKLKIKITENECWESLNLKPKKDGRYYSIIVGSRKDNSRKSMLLHRYMYEYFKEKIPNNLIVRHSCDNALCVNPNHLLLGTHKDNSSSKLTNKERVEIKDLYKNKLFTQIELSKLYNISQRQISNIVNSNIIY